MKWLVAARTNCSVPAKRNFNLHSKTEEENLIVFTDYPGDVLVKNSVVKQWHHDDISTNHPINTAEASYEQLDIDLAQHCEMYDFSGDEQADVSEPEKNNGIMDELRDWVSGSHLPHVLVNQLAILMHHFPNLPKYVRFLLKTCQI